MSKPAFSIPIPLIALDGLGSVLVALGLAEGLAGMQLVPEAFRFPNFEWVLVALGAMMMAPFVIFVLRTALQNKG